jgi:hypothetical protein
MLGATADSKPLAANQRLQTKIREMVAHTRNPTPAIAHDSPTDVNVRISATQATTGKTPLDILAKRCCPRQRGSRFSGLSVRNLTLRRIH